MVQHLTGEQIWRADNIKVLGHVPTTPSIPSKRKKRSDLKTSQVNNYPVAFGTKFKYVYCCHYLKYFNL